MDTNSCRLSAFLLSILKQLCSASTAFLLPLFDACLDFTNQMLQLLSSSCLRLSNTTAITSAVATTAGAAAAASAASAINTLSSENTGTSV